MREQGRGGSGLFSIQYDVNHIWYDCNYQVAQEKRSLVLTENKETSISNGRDFDEGLPFFGRDWLEDNLEIIESTKVPLAGLLFLELAQIRQTVESKGREAEHNLGLSAPLLVGLTIQILRKCLQRLGESRGLVVAFARHLEICSL